MSKDIRRVHPRVSYEQRIRLLDDDGKPLMVGRTLNLSPSGIYVRAPNGCEIGSEVTCDLPLPGGTRQLRGRVTRTQALPDESTGIGIQFVDLTTGDSSSLHRALEGNGPRPVAVKVLFEGMANPIKCHGVVTAEGLRLSTTLPFLRLGSDVKALYDGQDSKIDARGVLTGVRLEPAGGDGVPRLGVDVEIDYETPLPSAALARSPEPSRDDAAVGGAFTTWDRPPATAGAAEPAVVTDPDIVDAGEVTAIVRPLTGWRKVVVARFEALPVWGFVVVAVVAFGVVYLAISRVMPTSAENRQATATATDGAGASARSSSGASRLPLIVPSAASPEAAAAAAAQAPSAPAPGAAAGAAIAAAAVDDGSAAASRPRARPRAARPHPPGSPFQFDQTSGRYELRPGAAIDMKGEPLIGLGGIAAPEGAGGTNMRGINLAVESGALFQEVTLPHPETDGKFAVQVTPSWPTTLAIVGKSATGFTVSFGSPAPENAHFDWFLIR